MQGSDDQARIYRQLSAERSPDDRQRWILLIKEIRVTHGCSIDDAERIALLDPVWKRWVERQISVDQRCEKMARRHIRREGEGALLIEEDGKLKVR